MKRKNGNRRASSVSAAMLTALLAPAAAIAQEAVYQFDIPAQDLSTALRTYGQQANQQIAFEDRDVRGKQSAALVGAHSADDGLRILLAGSGLRTSRTQSGVVVVQDPNSAARRGGADGAASGDEIIVTGSRIRGVGAISPVLVITEKEMRMQGATDLGQVARNLPQSFGGGQNPGVSLGAGGIGNQNITGSSSLNLRGLGQDATLTLLNGNRLPYDGFTQATDVASVPIAAIDRMEVLLDGASAIYGSDAVGGVANIILKRDYDGAEVSARWGEAANGGYEQQQVTTVAGTVWDSGGFIVTGDYNRNTGIKAGERDYLQDLAADFSIYPSSETLGAVFSGHQRIGSRAEFNIDAFYTGREGDEFRALAGFFGFDITAHRDTTIWGVAPAVRFEIPGDWSLRLYGSFGENHSDITQEGVTPDNAVVFTSIHCDCNDAQSAGVETEGPVFALPGGDVRLALGGGYRRNEYKGIDLSSGSVEGGEDSNRFVYGEIHLPLVSKDQDIPLVRTFSLDAALRYEDHDNFGESTTPKIGAVWGVTPDIDLKASWGESFKVPTLRQQYQPIFLDLFDPVNLGGVTYPPGSGALFMQGGNRDLTPEHAETLTAGFELHPEFAPGFNLQVSWFKIDYADRVVQPLSFPTALTDPAGFEFIAFHPTVEQQNAAFALAGQPVGTFTQPIPPGLEPYDPARIVAIVNFRYVNASAQRGEGVDLTASYAVDDVFGGSLVLTANATWLEIQQALTSAAPEQTLSGSAFHPPDFRGRAGATWSTETLSLAATVNYTDGVVNTLFPEDGEGDGMTTVDVVADYIFKSGPLGGEANITFGVQNLFDEEPPYLRPAASAFAPFPYDSTNYSAIGRVVYLTLTQRF